jgi:transcriptional regulator with XRE-family HTH domain
MANRRETPQAWQALMEARRIGSARQLAERAGLSVTSVTAFLHGDRDAEDETAKQIADALAITVEKAWELRGEVGRKPFTLPAVADRLTPRQRDAVRAIVLAMVEPGELGETGQVIPLRPEPADLGHAARPRRGVPRTPLPELEAPVTKRVKSEREAERSSRTGRTQTPKPKK